MLRHPDKLYTIDSSNQTTHARISILLVQHSALPYRGPNLSHACPISTRATTVPAVVTTPERKIGQQMSSGICTLEDTVVHKAFNKEEDAQDLPASFALYPVRPTSCRIVGIRGAAPYAEKKVMKKPNQLRWNERM